MPHFISLSPSMLVYQTDDKKIVKHPVENQLYKAFYHDKKLIKEFFNYNFSVDLGKYTEKFKYGSFINSSPLKEEKRLLLNYNNSTKFKEKFSLKDYFFFNIEIDPTCLSKVQKTFISVKSYGNFAEVIAPLEGIEIFFEAGTKEEKDPLISQFKENLNLIANHQKNFDITKELSKLKNFDDFTLLACSLGGSKTPTLKELIKPNNFYFDYFGVDVILDNEKYKILSPNTVKGSAYTGYFSSWCTKFSDKFNFYTLDNKKLYIIYDKKIFLEKNNPLKMIQVQYPTGQIMDQNDQRPNNADFYYKLVYETLNQV